ncbi:hypothetical protein IWW55_004177 [Coemansia sp. RSA 2706]|nr:hypothetical protein IWW55_004177 [Coemansia sp. RSA 2706]
MTAESNSANHLNDGEDTIVTACGYLTAQADLEREAAEVLSGKFDECTYDKGYLKRLRSALAEMENTHNVYNHNFWGFYCRCDQFYDPDSESGMMIQCLVCNDWFHDKCIGKVPDEERYDDYICRECVDKHSVLHSINSSQAIYGIVTDGQVIRLETSEDGCCPIVADDSHSAPESDKPATKKARISTCQLRQKVGKIGGKQSFDLFMSDGWKDHICTCIDCMREIEHSGLGFLIKEEDLVEPEEDDTRTESLYESALRQMQTLDHTQAVDAAAAYHSLSRRLKDYLRPFATSGAVVTGQDIRAFFDQQARSDA